MQPLEVIGDLAQGSPGVSPGRTGGEPQRQLLSSRDVGREPGPRRTHSRGRSVPGGPLGDRWAVWSREEETPVCARTLLAG